MDLKKSFELLCLQAGIEDSQKINAIYEYLEYHYGNPNRVYHNLSHIEFMLKEYEYISHMLDDTVVFRLAVWFHDVIYDIKHYENSEIESALTARTILTCAGVDAKIITDTIDIILSGRYAKLLKSKDGKFFNDLDYSVLGLKSSKFVIYDKKIREEFVDKGGYRLSLFLEKRKKFLTRLMESEYIFHTDYFRTKYEQLARENIKKRLSDDCWRVY